MMERTGNPAGQTDQLGQALALQQQLTQTSGRQAQELRLRLMRAYLTEGDYEGMQKAYDDFMSHSAAPDLIARAQCVIADSHFFAGAYRQAYKEYKNLPISTFPSPEADDALYRQALSALNVGEIREASNLFARLQLTESYRDIARFYQAYISYIQEDYRRALLDFQNLPANIRRQMGADYYIANIRFKEKNYSEVLRMEPALLAAAQRINSVNRLTLSDAYRILGESAYATGDTARARANLLKHIRLDETGGANSARYILGVTDYDTGNYSKASEWLTPLADWETPEGQSALLYLGQCASHLGDDSLAAIYFDKAARMSLDPKVAETALYNYAAATAAGGKVPFGSATDLLEKFAAKYPDSQYAPAVDEYLATGYYREHRYADALERISHIGRPSAEVLQLKQRCQLDLGADLLAQGQASKARAYLKAASESSADKSAQTSACLWLGDCLYRLKEYAPAINAYDRFLTLAPRTDSQRGLALYDRAYAQFQMGRYESAQSSFNQALASNLTSSLKADATLRAADCLNYSGQVTKALDLYKKAASISDESGSDYAIFQQANMLGVLGRNAEKAATLEKLLSDRPHSSWCSAALAELAEARAAGGDIEGARKAIARLDREYPDSEQLRAASLSTADAIADKGKTADAITAYEDIVRRWPTSEQARVASENLQTICTEAGQLDRYLAFIKSVPGAPQPKADRVAALSYQAAVNALDKNPSDTALLEKYLSDFPQGANAADALTELADTYYTLGKYDRALSAANRLINGYPDSKGIPTALLVQAQVLDKKGDRSGATQAYNTLLQRFGTAYARQAYFGLLSNSTNPVESLRYANAYLALPDLPAADRLKATMLRAEALELTGQRQEALREYLALAKNTRTASGGEAAVRAARIYLAENQPGKAESLMSNFTAGGCDDPDWLAYGYIALADAYKAEGRTSIACQYLEALQENYPQAPAEITSEISKRLKVWK